MKRFFYISFVLTILAKLFLAIYLPMTGDEALFYIWSLKPQLGYYDHPPMVAWWIYLVRQVSGEQLFIRMPAILINHLIAFGLLHLCKVTKIEKDRAYFLAALYLILPVSVLNVLITTDTPLYAFSFLASMFFLMAIFHQTEHKKSYDPTNLFFAISGLALGMAFLSKYFAVLLGISFFAILAFQKKWHSLLILMLSALPFLILNLYWNFDNCWQNIMFNLVNRHKDYSLSWWWGLLNYLLLIIYVITPWVFWLLIKHWRRLKDFGPIFYITLIPFGLFLILALGSEIGLHWLISFVPLTLVLLGQVLTNGSILILKRYALFLTLPHILVISALIFLPTSIWANYGFYKGLSTLKNLNEISQVAKNYAANNNAYLMADGYSFASIMSFYLKDHIPVFGIGSKFGRHDDLNYDYRHLHGKNVVIFRTEEPDMQTYNKLGDANSQMISIANVDYWLVLINDVQYAEYKANILRQIKEKYYKFPQYLPKCRCEFLDKYDLNY